MIGDSAPAPPGHSIKSMGSSQCRGCVFIVIRSGPPRLVVTKEGLIVEISARGLRKTTKETGLDRKTIRAILSGKKVKASTLAHVVRGLRQE